MRLTLVHPAIGRRPGVNYMRTWQMEPLPIAVLAALTPKDVEIAFYDDRMEPIAFDRPTDLVAIPVETYTAKRAYQIATRVSPPRRAGGDGRLPRDADDRRGEGLRRGGGRRRGRGASGRRSSRTRARGRLQPIYRSNSQPDLGKVRYDRSLFRGRRYLRIGLVETGRGCRFPCDFCAVQTFFQRTARHRPIDAIVAEIASLKAEKRLFFFVDDNFAADLAFARELAEALTPLDIRWVTQMSINAAHDEAFLAALARERLPRRADRLREPRRGRAARDAQDLQHHARRLHGGARQSAAPRHPRLRHLRVRL